MIPQGWQEKKLGEVSIFSRGLTYSKKDEVDISDNIVLRANNIDLISNTLNFDELKYLNENFIIPEDKKVKKNSILICISSGSKSHLGKVAFIDKDYSYAFGGFMGLITPMQCIFPRFLYYMLISQSFIDFTSNLTDGANINNLKYSDIKDFKLRICPLPEQERIVAKLDKAFEVIDKAKTIAETNLKNAKELFESTLNKAFTENTDGWKEKTLDKACKKISAGGDKPEKFSKEITEIYRVPIYSNGIENDGLYGYTDVPAIVDEAITISARGTIGFVCKRTKPYYPIVRLISAIPNDNINIDFMVYALQFMVPTGNGSSIPQLTVPMLKNKMIKYPSLSEQQKIVEKLDKLQEQNKQLEAIYTKKIKDLDELKQSILQKAFRGEL